MEDHEHIDISGSSDAADPHADEDPGQYLDRLFDGLQALQAKVNLKLAKLQRQTTWIFEGSEPATEHTPKQVRGALAVLAETQMDPREGSCNRTLFEPEERK